LLLLLLESDSAASASSSWGSLMALGALEVQWQPNIGAHPLQG